MSGGTKGRASAGRANVGVAAYMFLLVYGRLIIFYIILHTPAKKKPEIPIVHPGCLVSY